MSRTPSFSRIHELTSRIESSLVRTSSAKPSPEAAQPIWDDLTRFAQALLAEGNHGALALAGTRFSNLALASNEWKPQALCGTLGLLDPSVAIKTYLNATSHDHEPLRFSSKIPPSHPHAWLCACAEMALSEQMDLPAPDFSGWIDLAIDERPLSRHVAAVAAQSQPRFDPGLAFEALFASRRFGEFIHQRPDLLDVLYSCPGFTPEKLHPSLLLWISSDSLPGPHLDDAPSRAFKAAQRLPELIKAHALLDGIDLFRKFESATEAMDFFHISPRILAQACSSCCERFASRISELAQPCTRAAIDSASNYFPKSALFAFHACAPQAFFGLPPHRLTATALCAIAAGEWLHAKPLIKRTPDLATSPHLLTAICFGLHQQAYRQMRRPENILSESLPFISRCALSHKAPHAWISDLSTLIPEFAPANFCDIAQPALAFLASRIETRELRRHALLPAASAPVRCRI